MESFEADLFEVNVNLQETFSDLQTDLELKVIFSKERYESFWTQQKLRQKYPIILKEFRLLFIAFLCRLLRSLTVQLSTSLAKDLI